MRKIWWELKRLWAWLLSQANEVSQQTRYSICVLPQRLALHYPSELTKNLAAGSLSSSKANIKGLLWPMMIQKYGIGKQYQQNSVDPIQILQ